MSTNSGKDRGLRQGFSLKQNKTKQSTNMSEVLSPELGGSGQNQLYLLENLCRKMYVVGNTSAECEGNEYEVSLKPEL